MDSQRQRLRLISETAEVGDWQYILKTNTTLWSDYLYDFYELDKAFNCSELLEKTTLYQKSQKERMFNFIDQAISTKTQCHEEFMILMDDGRRKWQATTIYPVLDASGHVISLYGILQNISLKKQAEENNKKKHQFYNYILDRLPTELVVLDDKGRYIYANHAAIKSKERRGFVIGVNQDTYHKMGNWVPATESRRNEVMNECMASKESVIFEEAFTGSDGIVRTYIRNMYPLLDENNEVEFLVGHGMDITALKTAKETSFKHQQAIENAMDGIALLDNTGSFYYMNASYVTIFGYKNPEEQIGKTLHDFYPDHEIERINNQISPIL
ncbi:MAG: PAS domain-containing protein, partial [Betaproteobacteria bacterium]|nr:PAS domain-containing protein [Betaproteobacteria bacterium]